MQCSVSGGRPSCRASRRFCALRACRCRAPVPSEDSGRPEARASAADAADAAEALFAELLPLSLPHPVNIDATITAVKTAATAFLFMIFPSCVVPAAFSRRKRFCLSVVRTLYLHTAVSRAADKSLKKLLLVNQPFMDPIITPFTSFSISLETLRLWSTSDTIRGCS